MRRAAIPVLLGFLASASPLSAQEAAPVPRERPRVCLALSGGGAKGIAHIGVLRVLEELNVPVDCIAGTSMGAIIGGLYASGLSVDELEKAVLAIDWEDALEDQPRREDLSFRRKEEDRLYVADLELGWKDGRLRAPGGLRAGQKLVFLLRSLTLPVAGVRDFDRLPVPFRAVATDAGTGDMVVLSGGDLAWALRASMAIPGVFSPVTLDGRILVDGGVSNNVPVDVARAMGADVVIAVDIAGDLASNAELTSFLSVTRQTLSMLTRNNMEARLAQADLVIRPEGVRRYGTLQFTAGADILRLGEDEARGQAGALRRWSRPGGAPPRPPRTATRPVVDAVRVEGNRQVDERAILARLRARPGEPLDLERLSADIGAIYGLGDFDLVDFALETSGGRNELIIRVEEKPWGPYYLRAGLSANSDLDGAIELGLLASLNATRLNARGAEWRTDVALGRDRSAVTELYQPLSFSRGWFVAPSFRFEAIRRSLYEDGQETAELDVRNTAVGLDLGYEFDEFGEARLGLVRGRRNINVETGEIPAQPRGFDLDRIDTGGISLRATLDRLDSAAFPTRGGFAQLRAFRAEEALGSLEGYTRIDLGGALYRTHGRNTFSLTLQAGLSPGGALPVYDEFELGGFLRLSGFALGELRGDTYGLLRAAFRRRLTGKIYAGAFAELGDAWSARENPDWSGTLLSTSLFVGTDTFLGPVYVTYSQAEEGRSRFYLALGRVF